MKDFMCHFKLNAGDIVTHYVQNPMSGNEHPVYKKMPARWCINIKDINNTIIPIAIKEGYCPSCGQRLDEIKA